MKSIAITLIAMAAVTACAQGPKATEDSLSLRVLVASFVDFQFDSPEIVVNGRPGANATGSVGFTVKSNGSFLLGINSVSKPRSYRGPATLSASLSINGGPVGGAAAGTVSVTVSGISLNDRAGSYTGGRIVVEVSQI